MNIKKTTIIIILLGFGLIMNNTASLLDTIIQVPYKQSVLSYQSALSDKQMGFLLMTKKNNLVYYYSIDGHAWKKPIIISDQKISNYTVTIDENLAYIIYLKDKNKSVNLYTIDHNKNKIIDKKIIYHFKGKTAYSPQIAVHANNLIIVYIDHYSQNAILKLLKIKKTGKIIYNHTLLENGLSYLPQVKVSDDVYLVVWNNLNGTREEIYYASSKNNGKSWKGKQPVLNNDFKDQNPQLCRINNTFHLVWQDNRLGSWNITYAQYKNNKWTDFIRLTNGLINCWLPQCGIYKNQLFIFWLDQSKGDAHLFMKKKKFFQNTWDEIKDINANINNPQTYKINSSESLILLSFLKNNKLYYSKLSSLQESLSCKQQSIEPSGYKISWHTEKKDIDSFTLTISDKKEAHPDYPLLGKKINHIYLYSENPSLLNNTYFHIRYYDDIDILSPVQSLLLKKKEQSLSIKKYSWDKYSINKIYQNILENQLYIKFKYKKGLNKTRILGKLYFYILNSSFQRRDQFNKLFNQLNGNIDFHRLIDGDEIYLPMIWENTFFVNKINSDIDETLKQIESFYDLKDKGYIYYILDSRLKNFKSYQQVKEDDFLVVIIP